METKDQTKAFKEALPVRLAAILIGWETQRHATKVF